MSSALFVPAFIMFFVTADPIGTAAVFSVLTGSYSRANRLPDGIFTSPQSEQVV
ncbi:MAG: hypothetical protein HY052_01570 [Proteobacteria bacterium]|nr:hypothetical protein [Pseudomonadota bacterium]